MNFWTYHNLADVTQGRWLVEPDDLNAAIAGLWHDTRDLKPGQAYLAIAGETFDGHTFIDKAFEAGAALAIARIDHQLSIINHQSRPILLVNDTIKALQDLARAYRDVLKQGGCKVIGIAGSNGKTTTRHLIHHVLTHAGLKGTQSPKSFNNHLGVPLTLLSGKPQDDFVACEIGTNHPGEIDFLSAIARPDIAVITSIGEEHLEFFKDLEGVAKEELAITQHLQGERVVVAGRLGLFAERLSGYEDIHVRFADASGYQPPDGMRLLGEHNRINAAMAWCVAKTMGLSREQCDRALGSAQPEAHRGVLIRLAQDVLIYDDCYNANPSSMRAALDTLVGMADRGRKIAVLGDMFELGVRGPALHAEIAREASGKVRCVFIGDMFTRAAGDVFAGSDAYVWSDDLPDLVAALLNPGDTVLLKASRGMRLERLIPAIERRFGPATSDLPT